MKKVLIMLIIGILLISCGRNSTHDQTLDSNVAISDDVQQEFTVKENEKINHIFEEGKNLKYGVEMVDNYFSNAMIKGEDGCCYYFRKENKAGEGEKIAFYRNNNQKVCETEMPPKIRGYKINRFVQYQDYFFVELYGDKQYLSAIHIKDGTWEEMIEGPGAIYKIFIYDNKFICAYDEKVIVYSLTGDKKKYYLEKDLENAEVSIQCIVDEKIYYFYGLEGENNDESKRKVKCCDLNGENNKIIFQYHQSSDSDIGYDNLRFEDQYIYLLADHTLFRIPLYGGKIEKVSDRNIYFYDVSDTYIFFLDDSDGKLYKIKKDLSGEIILVKEPGPCNLDIPFICVGNHIMLKECDDDQEELITDIAENELPGINIEYVNDYNWITEEGTIEGTIKGTHLSDEQYKKYKREIDEGSQMIYETKEQAEEYAINLFKEKYPDVNLENYDIITEDESEEYWVVYASLKVEPHKGGGGPSVKFKKMDGSILEIGLQK